MSITDTARLVSDLKAVVGSITPTQLDILFAIRNVIDERVTELNAEIEAEANEPVSA